MKRIPLGTSKLSGSRLAYGCWRIAAADGTANGRKAVQTAFDAGYTVYDLADIYGGGESEKIFGEALRETPGMRGRILVASKCGIRRAGEPDPGSPYRYDFSEEYIVQSCEGTLQRLGIDTIDLYQLHRPDYLMDPEEVARAFERLRQAGKVLEFGVSNFRPTQLTALQRACPMRLVVNQVEISLVQQSALEDGTLDQCCSERITPMAWSPLAGGQLADGPRKVLPSQEGYQTTAVNSVLEEVARQRGTTRAVIGLAWLLKHPSGIMPIVGSTSLESIRGAARADEIDLTREEWYRLFAAGRGQRLP